MPQFTVTKVLEGESVLVVRVDFQSDGTGELVRQPILTPNDCVPKRPPGPAFGLMESWYGTVWFDVQIGVGTLAPVPLWTVARDCDSHACFENFGGLLDSPTVSPPSDGVLWITTNGFNIAGSFGTLVMRLKKLN